MNVPKQLADLPVERLPLSVRSFNALQRNGIATVGQLLLLSAQDLLSFHAFGRKSLIDVQTALNQLLAEHSQSGGSEGFPSQSESVPRRVVPSSTTPGGWLCPHHISVDLDVPVGVLDLSPRSRHGLHRAGIKSVRQLMDFSKDAFREMKNIGRTSVLEVQLKLSNYLSGAPLVMSAQTHNHHQAGHDVSPVGTKALVDSMLARLPERAKNIICDRYGLWDGVAETLQDIGDKLGVTRERIRQIEKKSVNRFQHIFSGRWLSEFVARKLAEFSTRNPTMCGVLVEGEAISAIADDCSDEEAALAASLLDDIASVRGGLLARCAVQVEPGVYCLNKKAAADYGALLETITSILNKCQKPISEAKLLNELAAETHERRHSDDSALTARLLAVSPSITRLRSGQIGLSRWTEFQSRTAPALAEAALRLIGKPAHFRDITTKANELVESQGGVNERSIHNAIIRMPEKFVWVSSGTYGLAAWGIQKPPYLKDRLIQLLSETKYPLPYWHLRDKALEVCHCKEASIRMTLDLNSKIFKKFEGDQYGLRKHDADSGT